MRKINTSLQQLSLFALCAFMLASCANIDIVKRKYRPGYHVNITKKEKPRAAETTAKAEEPKQNPGTRMESKKPEVASSHSGAELATAGIQPAAPDLTAKEKDGSGYEVEDRKVKRSDFRWSAKKKKKHAKKPMFSSSDHWSAWVAFFSGAAGATFGVISFIVAFFGIAFWPTAIFFGVVAIVFSIIHMKKGWSGTNMRRWGFILGLVGAGLGLLSLIIWAIWFFAILS